MGIAALYLGGLRLWPGVLHRRLLANNYAALPVGTALAQTCGNMAEVLVGGRCCSGAWREAGSPLESVGGVIRLLAAVAVATALSATVGSLAQLAGGVIETDALATVWRTWWLGDTTGALVLVPLAIAWCAPAAGGSRSGAARGGAPVRRAVAALTELALEPRRARSPISSSRR